MHVYIFFILFLIGVKGQSGDKNAAISAIFGNASEYIPPGYEIVTKAPLVSLTALPRCGTGVDQGKKVCVVYHRCDPETNTVTPEDVNTTGEGIFDIRENANECESYLDVCCKLPEGGVLPTPSPTPPVVPVLEPAFCGIRNEQGLDFKIKGHTNEAEYGEFPWMIALLKVNFNPNVDETQFLCGGSLIAPSVVLTGAHCVKNYQENNLNEIKIRAGEWDSLTLKERIPHQERKIKGVVIHQQFNPKTVINDVALLILDKPLSQAKNIGTICLPSEDQVFDSKNCFASGWGKAAFGNKFKYSAILKKIQVPIVPRDTCQVDLRNTRLGANFILHPSFICAGGEQGQDTCTGDGGSPLVCPNPKNPSKYMQVGIVAWGIGCGDENVPGVYVNVARFRNWIDEEMKKLTLSIKPYNE